MKYPFLIITGIVILVVQINGQLSDNPEVREKILKALENLKILNILYKL
jgi:uncharacterized protein YneF (UPF0154 family)